jgi:hypothetical protein
MIEWFHRCDTCYINIIESPISFIVSDHTIHLCKRCASSVFQHMISIMRPDQIERFIRSNSIKFPGLTIEGKPQDPVVPGFREDR